MTRPVSYACRRQLCPDPEVHEYYQEEVDDWEAEGGVMETGKLPEAGCELIRTLGHEYKC